MTSETSEAKKSKYPILDDIDILADIACIPVALIMRVHAQEIEVFLSSRSPDNVYYHGEKALLGLYCETVMSAQRKLLVPNALKDPDWDHNPDIKLGTVSYCGLPLTWLNGEVFGTLCILDQQENAYTQQTHQLIERFRDSIQLSLASIYATSLVRIQKEELEQRVIDRTAQLEASIKELEIFTYSMSTKRMSDDQRSLFLEK